MFCELYAPNSCLTMAGNGRNRLSVEVLTVMVHIHLFNIYGSKRCFFPVRYIFNAAPIGQTLGVLVPRLVTPFPRRVNSSPQPTPTVDIQPTNYITVVLTMQSRAHAERAHVLVLAFPLAGTSLLADRDRRDVGDLLGGGELHEVGYGARSGVLPR